MPNHYTKAIQEKENKARKELCQQFLTKYGHKPSSEQIVQLMEEMSTIAYGENSESEDAHQS